MADAARDPRWAPRMSAAAVVAATSFVTLLLTLGLVTLFYSCVGFRGAHPEIPDPRPPGEEAPAPPPEEPRPMTGWRITVLGVAQDGGLPHAGCSCARCGPARSGTRRREKVACLGITDGTRTYLVDATPDLPDQLAAMGARKPVGSSRVDLQACKLEYSIVSPK